MSVCGYGPSLIRSDRPFLSGGIERSVALAAFSQEPFDARSACLAAAKLEVPDETIASRYREFGAPTLFGLCGEDLFWYQHETTRTRFIERIEGQKLGNFFEQHRHEFEPSRIYRAKTLAKFESSHQLSFVDAGLMPLLEQGSGEWLGRQVESLISTVHKAMPITPNSNAFAKWVFQSVFWLLAARMLRDKAVPSFKRIDITNPDDVFERVGRHYNSVAPPLVSKVHRDAMLAAAKMANEFPSLVNITTESLAYVYENTLVSQEVRDALGTHRTPSWLVDYIIWQLAPWIEEMPVDERHVLEPACGHSPFLVAALRLLRQFGTPDIDEPGRQNYLRTHIHGIEIDDFAREIGRLSLTLADVPNSNGWDLIDADMYAGNNLAKNAKHSGIVLSNPPFEPFTAEERRHYNKQPGLGIYHVNKAAELFARVVQNLAAGGVFGVVMPDSVLSSREGRSFRTHLVREYELKEICLFPDKVFENSEIESTIVLGRRRNPSLSHSVFVRRVHDWDLKRFEERLEVSTESCVPQSSFLLRTDTDLRLPDLNEVWDFLHSHRHLESSVSVQKGFEFKGEQELDRNSVVSSKPRKNWTRAYLNANDGYSIWSTPTPSWIDYAPKILRERGGGVKPGTPQVLVNYARISRSPWRVKAVLDLEGCPVTTSFLAFRPLDVHALPLITLWAVLNSPVANAYSFSITSKRQVTPRQWRTFPLPALTSDSIDEITFAASAYRSTAIALDAKGGGGRAADEKVHGLLMRMDSAVVKAYRLPPDLEQQLLSIFDDKERAGTGCKFTSYPKVSGAVNMPFHLRILMPRVSHLTDLRLAGMIKPKQQAELDTINAKFDDFERTSPSTVAFESWMADLRRQRSKVMSKLDEIETSVRRKREEAGK